MRELVEQMIVDGASTRRVTINQAESPMAWLARAAMSMLRQLEAGERLRTDYETAARAARHDALGRLPSCASGARPNGSILRSRRSPRAAASMRRWRRRDLGWPTSCGAWSARAKGWGRRRRRSAGPAAPASSSCASRSIGWRIIMGWGEGLVFGEVILPRQGEVSAQLTEGEDSQTSLLESSPSVAFGATSPWRGRIECRSRLRPRIPLVTLPHPR
jgi:hypothetical protein